MAFSRILFTVLLLSVSCYATKVPTFLWGDVKPSSKANPFVTITAEEFSDILEVERTTDPFTVVFIEETLSVEDLSRKNADGESSFPFLRANLGKSKYLPSVENPVTVLNELAATENVDHVKLVENGLSADIEPGTAKFLFINLKDAKEGESRVDMLQRHNNFMQKMYKELKEKNENVLAIYTALKPSWVVAEHESYEIHSRIRRQTNESSTESIDNLIDGLSFYAKNIQIIDGNNTVNINGNFNAQTVFNDTEQNTTMTFGENSFVMNFRLKAGYWFFESVTFNPGTANEEDLHPNLEVFALEDWSYRCAQSVLFNSANISRALKFEDLQIQPFFKTTNVSMGFGESFDCVGYFSAPIWAGLMVTFLLLAITFYGILMIIDIRTMDRFDDPKGKTITINTAE